MANPLKDLQGLIQTKKEVVLTAEVIRVVGQKVKVELNTGNSMTVWGTAKVGETVLIRNSAIIAVVGKETATNAYVP